MRAVDEALGLVAEPTEQHDLRLLRCSVGTETEIAAKAKPFIKAEAIRINAMTTVEFKAGLGIKMGGIDAAALIFSDDSSSMCARSTSR